MFIDVDNNLLLPTILPSILLLILSILINITILLLLSHLNKLLNVIKINDKSIDDNNLFYLQTIIKNFIEFTLIPILFKMNEKQRHIWQIIFEMFTDYYIFVLFLLSFFILNYLKFATSEWFDQISDLNLESIIKEIGQMAGINRMILSILSPLLLIFAASSIIDLIF
ncbi:hypothetical protein DERP_009797 [Dermatophagoides pteronyssinus]|uniref:Uncharacterized protein n=1 Tax=Dermatophagoides pteronyssinus TaxID=6956 RepID=A0ABQ8IRY0_DERPT|nr:hypothetical protein DERP_009797 [Dermatophagoides pteronyssinus]